MQEIVKYKRRELFGDADQLTVIEMKYGGKKAVEVSSCLMSLMLERRSRKG